MSNSNLSTSKILIVYDTLEVVNVSSADKCINRSVLFIIKSELLPFSSGKVNDFFSNTFFNSELELLKDNSFEYYGIKCKVAAIEKWGPIVSTSCTVLLNTFITDKEGNGKKIHFNNITHNGTGFKELFKYIKELNTFNTHKDLEAHHLEIKRAEKKSK